MSADFAVTMGFPNGLFWLVSEKFRELVIPDVDGLKHFWSSQNVWGIEVLHEASGPATLTVGRYPPVNPSLQLIHKGTLRSTRQLIEVNTVYLDRVATFLTRVPEVSISIWGESPAQPENVHIECKEIQGL